MSIRYTKGARAFICIIYTAILLILCTVGILIVRFIDPASKRVEYNVPELIPTNSDSGDECQFERVLKVILVDDFPEWITATDRAAFCLKKKSEGYWVIYALGKTKQNKS
ncbi:hypothetical protein ABGT23_01705 [Enterobacter cloacae]|uniref:hypothetical protein n=1 Tax=Enterobacter cloacae TaxID=550 RepID=UPI00345CAD85